MGAVLRTERLELVLLDPDDARALAAGRPDGRPWADGYPLGSTLLRAELTAAAAAADRPLGAFGSYQVVRRADGQVIGDVGFMGPPDDTGAVSLAVRVRAPGARAGLRDRGAPRAARVGERPGGPDVRARGHDAQQPCRAAAARARRLARSAGTASSATTCSSGDLLAATAAPRRRCPRAGGRSTGGGGRTRCRPA